ncbi:hypothetical protein ITJ66_16670 [Plantibacter sp. VKM Ac-2885]|uniref:hypothetical protein n=1 Tax=Plantibacter sp. VKM Ac-2885 TaxID=2783828 RepID=UPI00188BE1CC|nr:hypothetical protein [Plantibacter sp. VKM Ac-2885]MBF4514121.1 hypothetical protein [Plantibacter sp. VKM Ac-2885]
MIQSNDQEFLDAPAPWNHASDAGRGARPVQSTWVLVINALVRMPLAFVGYLAGAIVAVVVLGITLATVGAVVVGAAALIRVSTDGELAAQLFQ